MTEKYWVNNECETVSDELALHYPSSTRILIRKEKKIVEILEHGIVTFAELKANDEVYVMSVQKRVIIT